MIADSDNTSLIQKELAAFGDVDAAYAVIEPDTGRFCGNKAAEVRQLEGEELETYRALSSRGMRYYMPLRKCLVTMSVLLLTMAFPD